MWQLLKDACGNSIDGAKFPSFHAREQYETILASANYLIIPRF